MHATLMELSIGGWFNVSFGFLKKRYAGFALTSFLFLVQAPFCCISQETIFH